MGTGKLTILQEKFKHSREKEVAEIILGELRNEDTKLDW